MNVMTPPLPGTMPLCEASIACQEDHSTLRLGHGCNAHRAFNAVTSTKFQKVLNYFPLLSIVPVRENKKLTFSPVFVFFSSPGWKEEPGGYIFIVASSWGSATPPTNEYLSGGPVLQEMDKSRSVFFQFLFYRDFIMIS